MSTELAESASLPTATAAEAPSRPGPLSKAEIQRRLALDSPELVKELYDIAQRQHSFEIGRQGRLDSKGTSLLTAAGLSLSVAGTLIARVAVFDDLITNVACGACVLLGLSAAICAVVALTVKGKYQTLHSGAIFDKSLLHEANHTPHLANVDMTDDEKRKYGVMEYQKMMTAELWGLSERYCENIEAKARWIKRGQFIFLGFLLSLIPVCFLLAVALKSSRDQETAAEARSAGAAAEGRARAPRTERRERQAGTDHSVDGQAAQRPATTTTTTEAAKEVVASPPAAAPSGALISKQGVDAGIDR